MTNPVTMNDAANRLEVTPRTLRRWIKNGYFPAPSYIGRRAVYDPGTVDSWINEQLHAKD